MLPPCSLDDQSGHLKIGQLGAGLKSLPEIDTKKIQKGIPCEVAMPHCLIFSGHLHSLTGCWLHFMEGQLVQCAKHTNYLTWVVHVCLMSWERHPKAESAKLVHCHDRNRVSLPYRFIEDYDRTIMWLHLKYAWPGRCLQRVWQWTSATSFACSESFTAGSWRLCRKWRVPQNDEPGAVQLFLLLFYVYDYKWLCMIILYIWLYNVQWWKICKIVVQTIPSRFVASGSPHC